MTLQNADEFSMLLALPCGHDHVDIIAHSKTLEIGFISYLQQKQAAGIVNVPVPGSPQVSVRTELKTRTSNCRCLFASHLSCYLNFQSVFLITLL